jgi:hypothetical protein
LVERALPRLLGGRLSTPIVAGQLARTMEDGLRWMIGPRVSHRISMRSLPP